MFCVVPKAVVIWEIRVKTKGKRPYWEFKVLDAAEAGFEVGGEKLDTEEMTVFSGLIATASLVIPVNSMLGFNAYGGPLLVKSTVMESDGGTPPKQVKRGPMLLGWQSIAHMAGRFVVPPGKPETELPDTPFHRFVRGLVDQRDPTASPKPPLKVPADFLKSIRASGKLQERVKQHWGREWAGFHRAAKNRPKDWRPIDARLWAMAAVANAREVGPTFKLGKGRDRLAFYSGFEFYILRGGQVASRNQHSFWGSRVPRGNWRKRLVAITDDVFEAALDDGLVPNLQGSVGSPLTKNWTGENGAGDIDRILKELKKLGYVQEDIPPEDDKRIALASNKIEHFQAVVSNAHNHGKNGGAFDALKARGFRKARILKVPFRPQEDRDIRGRISVDDDGSGTSGRPRDDVYRWLAATNRPTWRTMPQDTPVQHPVRGKYFDGKGWVFYPDPGSDPLKNHEWATSWLVATLMVAAEQYYESYLLPRQQAKPNASPIGINDLSLQRWPGTRDHGTHQTGMNVDIRLPRKLPDGDASQAKWHQAKWWDDNYDSAAMRAQLQALSRQPLVQTILFNDPDMIGDRLSSPWVGHDNHVHLQIAAPNAIAAG